MTPKLAIEHLRVHYRDVRAVNDVSFSVRPGCIFGLIGRNGAGKTTTFGCALGLLRPTSGTVLFDGSPLSPRTLADVAYLPETPALFGWMTPSQHVEFWRRLYPNFSITRAHELAEIFEVPLQRRVGRLSKGQQTAVGLMLAFAQGAQLLFLDEPASGLDPVLQHRLLNLIVDAGSEGVTVFSSHQIGHIERAVEELAILDRGRVLLQGNLDELRERKKVVEAIVNGSLVRRAVDGDADAVALELSRGGAHSVRILDQTLEQLFFATIGGDPV